MAGATAWYAQRSERESATAPPWNQHETLAPSASTPEMDLNCQELMPDPYIPPYVIAPSFTKQFNVELQCLLLDAMRFARVASNLIIIGCGLRPEDSRLWLVLTSFSYNRRWRKKRTLIVSPHASKTKERIETFWGRKIFNQQNLVAIDLDFKSGISRLENALRDVAATCIRSEQTRVPTTQPSE